MVQEEEHSPAVFNRLYWLGFGLGLLLCNYVSFIVIIIVYMCNV